MNRTTKTGDPNVESSLAFARAIASKHGYELNPNETQLQRLVKHLADNRLNHGRYFCPCKQHYPLDPKTDPVCPCPSFHEEIGRQGHCECHLFFSPEAALQFKNRPGLLANVTCPG